MNKAPGWKESGSLMVPDNDPIYDVEPVRFKTRVRGFNLTPQPEKAGKKWAPNRTTRGE